MIYECFLSVQVKILTDSAEICFTIFKVYLHRKTSHHLQAALIWKN